MRVLFNRVIYQNPENGYCVFVYSVNHDDDYYKQTKHSFYDKEELIVAKGYYLPTASSIEYDFVGEWVKTDKYGLNFDVKSFAPVVPTTESGIIAYLSSGLVKGVGEKTARLIVNTFGMNALNIIENSPEQLLTIKGISERKLKKIVDSYQNSHVMRDIISFLAPYNITINKITQIFRTFGNDSLRIINSNPYKLQVIDGFGFKTVDAIARHINIAPNDTRRIEAATEYVLGESKKSGHLYLEEHDLYKLTSNTLNEGYSKTAVEADEMLAVINAMLANSTIINDGGDIYLSACFNAEVHTARDIARIHQASGGYIDVSDEDIEEAEAALGITLAQKQKEAAIMCLRNNISIVTGGPGTGKTTTLKAILHLYKKKSPGDIALMAPTGKAARRMEESTGMPASTIHSALNIYSDDHDSDNVYALNASLYVIDEFSMVDMFLANKLFSAIPSGAKVLLVGDPDQLPSIGPGNVFRELITCSKIPVTVLDIIYRQSGTSPIVTNAAKINTGDASIEYGPDFYMAYAVDDVSAADLALQFYQRALETYEPDSVQILSPYRAKTEAGVNRMNEAIQRTVNPPNIRKKEVQHGNRTFRVGDRVMQIKNHNGISNGDVGVITRINVDTDGDVELAVLFSGNRVELYEREDLNLLDLSYATTVHKSQGSEYRVVILVLCKCFFVLLKRNLLYTAVTRAKEKVVIIGQEEAVNICIRNNDIDKRNTRFGERVCANISN